jgi:predicted  nucleic acid-binding Zn-ribbon protein
MRYLKIKLKTVLIALVFFALSGLFLSNITYADVVSPKKQIELKIKVVNVSCKQGFVKVIKAGDESPACVKPSTAEKLEKLGWAKQLDPKKIESAKMASKEPIGEIKKILVSKVTGDAGRLETAPRTVAYNFVFDACAFGKTIRSPQVLVTSGSESKTVQLAGQILANTCQTNVVKIRAVDPNTITGELLNKGGITEKISTLETKITDLRKQIEDEKKKLSDLAVLGSDADSAELSKTSKSLLDLRQQLNLVRGEYNTYLFSLHVNSASISEFKKPLSFEGNAIEGVSFETVNIYKTVDSTDRPFTYNAVFKICSDLQTIRVPQVKVTSDAGSIIVNMADKIPVKTCQTSIAKIKATNIESISYELGTTNAVSTKISDLQQNIDTQQKSLGALKEELSQLTRIAQKPIDFEDQVTELTNKIIDLRNKINSNKTQLAQFQFQFLQ